MSAAVSGSVGGFAHAMTLASLRRRGGTLGDFYRSRVTRLLPPVLVLLGVWAAVVGVLEAGGWERGPVALAADRVTTPLWFIGVYLIVVLFAPLMEAGHRRYGRLLLAVLVVLGIGFDVLEFRYDQLWAGVANLVVIWLAIHQLGFFWADGSLTRGWVPAVCAVAGVGVAVLLTYGLHWYPVLMVGLPGRPTSNMAPPDVALLAYAIGQLGVVLLLRAPAARWLRRTRVWLTVVYGNGVVMTLFCWHLSAVFVVQGVLLLAGLKPPAAGTAGWWGIFPVWIAACAVPLAALLLLFRWAERVPAPPPTGAGPVTAAAGVCLAAIGVFVVSQVGLDGLFLGASEEVNGVTLAGWMGLAALLAGLVLLRGWPIPARPTAAG
ncbi:acyltransferase family protein [Dactylosporangium sp. NPDC051541]|uniref:acyltransferase family protein n=1 Tax=Dactylosporangium sp. NPDC051541 TaxID=3363977 RepID=UPI0037B8C04B